MRSDPAEREQIMAIEAGVTDLHASPSFGHARLRLLADFQRGQRIVRVSVGGVDCEHVRPPFATGITHGMISRDAILSPSSSKKNRRSTGLPGKFPVSRQLTTVFPPLCSQAEGSQVY